MNISIAIRVVLWKCIFINGIKLTRSVFYQMGWDTFVIFTGLCWKRTLSANNYSPLENIFLSFNLFSAPKFYVVEAIVNAFSNLHTYASCTKRSGILSSCCLFSVKMLTNNVKRRTSTCFAQIWHQMLQKMERKKIYVDAVKTWSLTPSITFVF